MTPFRLKHEPVDPKSDQGRAAHAVLVSLAARQLAQPVEMSPIPGSESRFGGMRWQGGDPLHSMGNDPIQLYAVADGLPRKLDFESMVVCCDEPWDIETIRVPAWSELVLVCRDDDPGFFASAVRLTLARGAHALTAIINPRGLSCEAMRYIRKV